jgi:hypothetical protein
MTIHEFSATIAPGQTQYWWTNVYRGTDKPQLDAYPIPTFPEGVSYTGIGARLWYGDFACKLLSSDFTNSANDAYEYYVTVRNDSTETCLYHMRVWIP